MLKDQVTFASVRAIDALVVTKHIFWVIFSRMHDCITVYSSIATNDLHLQRARHDLTPKSITESPQMTVGERIGIKFPAFCSSAIHFSLARVLKVHVRGSYPGDGLGQ